MTQKPGPCLLLCLVTLIGCSGAGSGSGSSAPPQEISVSVTPNVATVDGGDSITLTATVLNDTANAGVHWSTLGQGTFSNITPTSVTYTAPSPVVDKLSVNVIATSVSNSVESGSAALTIPTLPALAVDDYGISTPVGTPLSVQLQASGGIPPYTYTIAGGTLPPCINFTNGTFSTSGAPGKSCIGASALQIKITDSGTPTPVSNTQAVYVGVNAAPPITFSGNMPLNATIDQPYTGSTVTASGGAGALTYTISSGSLPPGISVNSSTGAITGTPTTAGTFNFTLTATDAYTDSASSSYQIVVNATNPNAALKGTYACLATGMSIRNGYTTPLSMVFSMVADGQGNITAGAQDISDATVITTNTLTGTYILSPASGTPSAGTAAIVESSTVGTPTDHYTRNWAIILPSTGSPVAHFRMLNTDVPPPNYTGTNGSAQCYLADPSAFTASTLNHSFAYSLHGVNAPTSAYEATAEAEAGRFDTTSGNIANGYLEDDLGGDTTPELVTFTGSFSPIDPTSGRTVATFTRSYHNATSKEQLALYFIDSTRALALDIGPWNGEGGRLLTGELRQQKQTSWSVANASGPFVLYTQGSDLTNSKGNFPVTGAYTQILEGSADGHGDITLNRSFRNDSGAYTSSSNTTTGISLGFDPDNAGHASLLIGTTPISLFFFDNNQAFELAETSTTVEFGRLEAQTQTTADNTTLAGTYIVGQLPPMPQQNALAATFTFNAAGSVTGSLNTVTPSAVTLDHPITLGDSLDTAAPSAGTFFLSTSLTTGASSCAALSSTTFVCLPQTDTAPYIFIARQ